MVSQSQYPDVWDCESPQKRVKVEIGFFEDLSVPNVPLVGATDTVPDWIEIPTNDVRCTVSKGGSAATKRTSKVIFPTEFGGASARNLFDDYEDFKLARVHFREEGGDWDLVQTGIPNGVGPAAEDGYSKFWIYDPVTYLDNIPISLTLQWTSMADVATTVAQEVDQRTPFPITDVVTIGEGVNVRERDRTLAEQLKANQVSDVDNPQTFGDISRNVGGGSETFRKNHDTVADVLNKVTSFENVVWYFYPTPDGVALVFDIVQSRRTVLQDTVADEEEDELFELLDDLLESFIGVDLDGNEETVSVLMNNALYEIRPLNTVRLRGETRASQRGTSAPLTEEGNAALPLSNYTQVSREFPQAVVEVPSLVRAAGGTSLAPKTIESDSAVTLDGAINEATSELLDRLSEDSEGEIVLDGYPPLEPYDRVLAYETCQDDVEETGIPVEYEVESVEHVSTSNQPYRTYCNVSVYVDESMVSTVSGETKMVSITE